MRPICAAVVIAALSTQACTLVVPVAWGMSADRYNDEERARAQAEHREPDEESVGARVVGGLFIGAAIDALLLLVAATHGNAT